MQSFACFINNLQKFSAYNSCYLFYTVALCSVLLITPLPAKPQRSVEQAIEQANKELWEKFIDKYGIIHDFVGEIPTPEDCALGRPNAIGWFSPIENASFFTGLYLPAACERARRSQSRVDREKARLLSRGLLRCASVSDVPGFISRGVGRDGKCHYPMGSTDQTVPWFYGLYRYLKSDIPTVKEQRKVKKKIEEVVHAIMENDWKLPCDGAFKGEFREDLKENRFLEVTCYLIILRAMFDITGENVWKDRYREALFEHPPRTNKSRAEICAAGYRIDTTLFRKNLDKQQLWIYIKNQASLEQLLLLEKDNEIKKYYREGLAKNVNFAMDAIGEYAKFDNNDTKFFGHANWREAFPNWFPQKTQEDARKLSGMPAREKLGERRSFERLYMTNPLAAAAIIALGDDGSHREIVEKAVCHYDYSKLNLSEFFFAEIAYYALTER